ncbi:MAG: Peptidase family M23 [Spirochaetes bacterium ADurb.Bin110]|nr:MAG: Peptidase family M23 [Spirochaetes bacterium ADurb.Bin110]
MRWLMPISLIVLALLMSCNTAKDDFTISGLGVNFAPYDPNTGRAGDFIFTKSPYPYKVFWEFGVQVNSPDGVKELPTFEYLVDPNANVMAITEGKVVWMQYQEESHDWEIGMYSKHDPEIYIAYDHINSPTIMKGEKVVSGQILGKPGNWDPPYGRFEIMLNKDVTGLSYCPFVFFDPALKMEYEQKVSQLMSDWETYKCDEDIYDEASQFCPGCRYETMKTY